MNTTFYKDEVDALKKMADSIESHKPQIGEYEVESKSFIVVVGIVVASIIVTVGFLTWWLVS